MYLVVVFSACLFVIVDRTCESVWLLLKRDWQINEFLEYPTIGKKMLLTFDIRTEIESLSILFS